MRAERVGAGGDLLLFAETNLRAVLDALETLRPRLLVVDSIQTMALPEVESFAGSVAQVRDCATALMEFAKRTNCATLVVGHVTKDGAIAGPRLLEHLVDTVLYFEGDNGAEYRIVRAHKNRFGSADEICVFAMDERGLHEVANPSQLFLGRGGTAQTAERLVRRREHRRLATRCSSRFKRSSAKRITARRNVWPRTSIARAWR